MQDNNTLTDDELIEKAEDIIEWLKGSHSLDHAQLIRKLCKRLKERPKVEWIPCSERMPEEVNGDWANESKYVFVSDGVEVRKDFTVDGRWMFKRLPTYTHWAINSIPIPPPVTPSPTPAPDTETIKDMDV